MFKEAVIELLGEEYSMSDYDIVIVGSGIVGATAALALAQKTSLKIAVIEAGQNAKQYDERVSAISLASKNIFQQLNCFEAIKAKKISPYTKMHVWDANSSGKIDFDCESVQAPALGYIIEDQVIRSSLVECFPQYENIEFLCPLKLCSLHETPEYIECAAEDGTVLRTKLLIAADGANSWVRETLGVEMKIRDYQHIAIVTTVKTELPHQKTAWQRFLATGPLAFLPLKDEHSCSIVWSAIPEYATELLAMNDEDFKKSLRDAFDHRLGEITAVSKRLSFPLRMRHAKNTVRERVALIGDAAHTIHPLAGQGVNLGIQDAMALADVIITAHTKKRDFASLATLRRYERARKSDIVIMLTMVDALKNLFASDNKSVKQLRSMGLNMTNQLTWIKNFLTRYAIGRQRQHKTIN